DGKCLAFEIGGITECTPRNWMRDVDDGHRSSVSITPGTRQSAAAVAMISTRYRSPASRASTVARAGGLARSIQPSQTRFISLKFAISRNQIWAERSLDLLLPAWPR